jgi:hypothetical protein
MSTDDATVRALADAIEAYLQAYPRAADSPGGIQTWWLPPPLNLEPLPRVVAALEDLEQRGIVQKTVLERGRQIYRRAKPHEDSAP